MNGTAQPHANVANLAHRLENVETVTAEVAERVVETAKVTLAAIDEEQLARGIALEGLEARIRLLEHDDLEHERVIVKLRPLSAGGFVQRLSWLLTGRG